MLCGTTRIVPLVTIGKICTKELEMERNVMLDGTFHITAALSDADLPITRMTVCYKCNNCVYHHSFIRGGTPRRTVTIELNAEGFLSSVEYLHPNNPNDRRLLAENPVPDSASCPSCRLGIMVPKSYGVVC